MNQMIGGMIKEEGGGVNKKEEACACDVDSSGEGRGRNEGSGGDEREGG